jgi:photosystem II stability/assembly factor-like uncharacterized protein
MLGIGRSGDGGKTWTQSEANAGLKTCEIAEFTFDPANTNVVWVATMDGPYKSADAGRSWMQKRAGLPADGQWGKFIAPIQKILFDPADARHLLAFGGNKRRFEDGRCFNYGTIWESTNAGDNWTLRGQIDPGKTNHEANITGVALAAGPRSKTFYASVPGYGVMRSDDLGAQWRSVNAGLPDKEVTFVAAHPSDPATLWVTLDKHGVYKSADGGGHWTACNTGMSPGGAYDTIVAAPSAPDVLYVNANQQTKTFRSTDGGARWTLVLTNGDNPYGMSLVTSYLAVDPHNASNVFIGTFVSIYHSTNGGQTWEDASATQVSASQNTWRGTGYGGLVCENYAWNPYDLSMSIGQAMDDGKLLLSRDDLQSWKVHHPGVAAYSGGGDVAFCRQNGRTIIYAALGTQTAWFTQDGVYRSADNGQTWMLTARPKENKGARSVYAFPNDPGKVFAVFADNQLYRSADSGSNWQSIVLLNPNGKAELSMANVTGDSLTNNPSRIYAAARGGIYESADFGNAWHYMTNSPTAGFDWGWGYQRVKADPTHPGGLLVINVNGLNGTEGLYRFDGNAWNKLAGPYNNIGSGITDAAIDPANGRHILAVCNQQPFQDISISTGVWETEDGGKTWGQVNNHLGMLRVKSVSFRPDGREIVIGTDGGGFYFSRR